MTQLTEKTIIRRQHDKENPYFMMARETAQNRVLSYEAIGVLAYLLSRPDDWKIMVADLQRDGCGRDKTLRILKELTDAGHLYRERGRDDKGHFVYGDYVVSERPLTEKPYTAEPLPDEPYTANPHLHNTDIQNTETQSTEREENARESTPVPAGLSNAIERAAQDVYQPIDNDTAAQIQGDMLMRRYEATCKQLGAPQTLNRRDTRLRRIAAQYYRDTYTPDEVQAAVEAGYADGKLIPFQFLGEKMGALRIPKPALVKGARPTPVATALKPQRAPETQTFDPQTWVRKEIEKGTFDPSVPPVLKVKPHVHA